MVDEKRFELRGLGVFDTENDNKSLSRVDVVELLNNLTEENKQLKRIERDSFDLFKENMLLFRKILKVKEIVREADCFSDEATKHDIIAYREMHSFDNKDAYDIACAFKKIMEILE